LTKERAEGLAEELDKLKETFQSKEVQWEQLLGTCRKDLEVHRKQLREYKEENVQLRKEKRDMKQELTQLQLTRGIVKSLSASKHTPPQGSRGSN